MATLQAAIVEIQEQVANLDRMRQAPSTPPDQIAVFPFAVCYPSSGAYTFGSMEMRGLHTIVVEVHVARKDLSRDYTTAITFAKSLPQTLFGAISASLTALITIGEIRYDFGSMEYAGVETLGFRFYLENVKTRDAIPAESAMLKEDGDKILTEAGDVILL